MGTRRFALIFGIVFLAVGVLGFVPGANHMHHPEGPDAHLMVHGPGTGHLLGLFHVNVLHNLAHVLFGVLGLAAFRTYGGARAYAKLVAVAYGALAVMGLISAFNIQYTFGLVPIEGNDVWLHAGLALVGAVFGFAPRRTEGAAVTDNPRAVEPII